MMLTLEQIQLLLVRLSWRPIYEDRDILVARKTGGYSDDKEIAELQRALSIMGEVAAKLGAKPEMGLGKS